MQELKPDDHSLCNQFTNFILEQGDGFYETIIFSDEAYFHLNRYLNPLTPKTTDFLTHFWPLLPKRNRQYIMTKPCIHNVFGSPLSIYEVRITLPCTGKPIWQILLKKVPKI